MQFVQTCADCQSLWQAYSVATTEHFEVINRLELAKLRHDREAVEHLAPLVEAAAARRAETRAAFRAHEGSGHSAAGAATA
jgi:hypothetical protein